MRGDKQTPPLIQDLQLSNFDLSALHCTMQCIVSEMSYIIAFLGRSDTFSFAQTYSAWRSTSYGTVQVQQHRIEFQSIFSIILQSTLMIRTNINNDLVIQTS